MKHKIKVVLTLISITVSPHIISTNKENRKIFDIDEEWYIQAQGGINYLMAENTRFVSPWKVVAPEFTLSLGKNISNIWSSRLQIFAGNNRGVYYSHDKNSPRFKFGQYGFAGIGAFNITEYISRNNIKTKERSWSINALMGLGNIYTAFSKDGIGIHDLDRNNSTFIFFMLGFEASKKINNNFDLIFELNSNWMSNKYNGQVPANSPKISLDAKANALVGLRYTLNRSKKSSIIKTQIVPFDTILKTDTLISSVEDKSNYESNSTTLIDINPKREIEYSVEDLIEMIDNDQSIKGLQLAKTESIRFDFGSHTIKPFNYIYLNKVAELVKKGNLVILIRGYSSGESITSNGSISDLRIKSVRDYILKRGIEREQLVYQHIDSDDDLSIEKSLTVELEILSL